MSAPEFSSAKKEIAKLSRETATHTHHGRCPKVTVQGRAAPELEVARRRNKNKSKGQCHRSTSKSGHLPFNAVQPNPFAYRRYRSSPRSSTPAGNVLRRRNNRAICLECTDMQARQMFFKAPFEGHALRTFCKGLHLFTGHAR